MGCCAPPAAFTIWGSPGSREVLSVEWPRAMGSAPTPGKQSPGGVLPGRCGVLGTQKTWGAGVLHRGT